jgi:hypothetical protein
MNANDIFIEYKISVDPPLSPFRFTPASLLSLFKSKKQYEKTKLIPPPSLSDVPVELIHHIQSLLPVKEAARTSIFSKAWLNAWQTIHKLRFRFKGMRQEMYYNLMLRALLRYQSNLLPIESFDLGLVISNKETASLVQDWIRHASSPKACLKELLLDISVSTDSSVTLPPEILSSKTLNSIIVTTDDTSADVKLSFHSNPEMILCVSLRVLDLEYVFISDDVLAKLLSVCSLLEKIRLFCCDGLKTVKVKNLVFLRELKIHVLDIEPIVTIINVPNLLKVDYFPLFPPIERPPPFNMDSFRSVTQLVIADVLMDYEFFDTIKSKLLCLESLTLRIGDWAQENFVISSVSLKKLDLQIWTSTQFVIEVCAPQLMSCVCECHEPAPIISFAAGNPKHLKVTTV